MSATQTTLAELAQRTVPAAAPRNLPAVTAGFFDLASFELMQRVSKAFSSSDLVPQQYRGNLPNCMIAMDMAQRIGANPLMVMQNLYIVHGNPSWSSKFLVATINASGRYSSLRYEWKGTPGKDDYGCRAWAIERESGERLDGVWVTWSMVNGEGWASKNGSKWKTMPDQMFMYRAAAFWQRSYAPELGMGLSTAEEMHDVYDATPDAAGRYMVEPAQQPASLPEAPAPTADPYAAARAEIAALRTQHDLITWMNAADKKVKAALKTDLEAAQARIKLNEQQEAELAASQRPTLTYAHVADRMQQAGDAETLDAHAADIELVADAGQRKELAEMYRALRTRLDA